jgi:PadR family transcriptional regulator, regulatory protein PadR
MKAEVLKGHLDGLLLATLEGGPQHGYALIDLLRQRTGGSLDLPTGTVYPALHRLERSGLIKSAWLEARPRPRRVYRLTAAGRRALHDSRATWAEFSAAVSAVLDGST